MTNRPEGLEGDNQRLVLSKYSFLYVHS